MSTLAVQLYSVRDHLARDREATLRRLAGMGYREVEAFDPARDAPGLRAGLDAAGLAACSTHTRVVPGDRDALPGVLAALGTDTAIVPAIAPAEFADAAGVSRVAEQLNEAAAWARGHGLRLGYHNHDWELASRIGGRPALEVLAEQLDPEVFLEVDVYWVAVGGVDVPELLGRLGARVRYLHVKDGPADAADRDAPMTAVGAGTLPIPDILAAAPQARRVVELDDCATDMFDALAASLDYLATLAAAG
jgi:sugar phosphate isomerase/epimerase